MVSPADETPRSRAPVLEYRPQPMGSPARLSVAALGAVALSMVPPAYVLACAASGDVVGDDALGGSVWALLLAIGLVVPGACVALGLFAIGRIERSGGALRGERAAGLGAVLGGMELLFGGVVLLFLAVAGQA